MLESRRWPKPALQLSPFAQVRRRSGCAPRRRRDTLRPVPDHLPMQLPDDLQTMILAILPAADLAAACQVSRRFAALERASQSTLWQRLFLGAFPKQRQASGTLGALSVGWKSRYRIMHRRGRPAEPPCPPAERPRDRLARLSLTYEFFLELSDDSGSFLASVPATLSGGLEEGVMVTSADPNADGFTLSTAFLLQSEPAGLEAASLPIGIGPAAAAGHGVGHLAPYGELLLRVFVRRRADQHVALFAEQTLSLDDDATLTDVPWVSRPQAWRDTGGQKASSLVVSNWDRGGVPFASTPLPGDGGYALLQEGVAWNLTYELACGFEVEFVQWRPQQMWLGFFLVPGHRRDETDPATWRAASRADPEPIGVELLTRMLAGAPAHLDWAPP